MLKRILIICLSLFLHLAVRAPAYASSYAEASADKEAASGRQDQHVSSGEQRRAIDSLNQIYQTAAHDTDRIQGLLLLGEALIGSNPDTVFIIEKKALELANQNLNTGSSILVNNKYLAFQAEALNNLGFICKSQGNTNLALSYHQQSLKIKQELGDEEGVATSLNNIGIIYHDHGDIKSALEFFHKALETHEKLRREGGPTDDGQGISQSLNNIGYIYKNQGDLEMALEYFQGCMKIQTEIGFSYGVAVSLNNIGSIYFEQGDHQNALETFQKSLVFRREIGDRKGEASSLNNIAGVYKEQGVIPLALEYYQRSVVIQEEIGDSQGVATSLSNIGGSYLDDNDPVQAGIYAQRSLDIAQELGFPLIIRDAALLRSQVFRRDEKFAPALEMYELYILMRDSINNQKTLKATIRQQTKYEFEKAQLVKEQEEKEASRILAEETSRRDNIQYSVILISLLVLGAGVMALGRISVSPRVAEGLIFFSFLILFEFLLVLADPYIEGWSGGGPGIKLLFNAGIAAFIFPLHAFFEKVMKRRLVT